MIHVEGVKRCMQTKFVHEAPGDNLGNDHVAKIIVHVIDEYEKEKPYLFPDRNCKGKRGPKFKHTIKEMLGLFCFCYFKITKDL